MTEPDRKLFLNRCIAQLDEGVLLANNIGTSALYRWAEDAGDLLTEIRESLREEKLSL